MRSLLVLALMLAACTDDGSAPPAGTQKSVVQVLPLTGANQLDVLIVVDDSPAMATHREQAIASARALVTTLSTLHGGLPDVHIGVTTSDPVSQGRLQVNGAPVTGTFASDIRNNDGGRQKNYTGDLNEAVGKMVDAGATGSAPQPLATIHAALVNNPNNAGFVREQAFLAVVVIAAADDASADAAETYAPPLKATKTDPSKVLAITVRAGDTPRLAAFLAQFPNRSSDGDLTASDPAAVYDLFANAQVTTLGIPCWGSALLDVDPTMAGLQAECTAELHTSKVDLAVVRCGSGVTDPCFSIVQDTNGCPQTGVKTTLDHFDQFSDGTVTLECLVAQ